MNKHKLHVLYSPNFIASKHDTAEFWSGWPKRTFEPANIFNNSSSAKAAKLQKVCRTASLENKEVLRIKDNLNSLPISLYTSLYIADQTIYIFSQGKKLNYKTLLHIFPVNDQI